MNTIPSSSQLTAQFGQILWQSTIKGLWMAAQLFGQIVWAIASQHPLLFSSFLFVFGASIALRFTGTMTPRRSRRRI